MAKTLYLLDGHYLIYRAFYGLPQQLTSPKGEPTGATHGFLATLFNLIRERRPDHLAMIMDVDDGTVFRRDLDPNYKAQRDPAPEALHVQADRIVSLVTALGTPIFRVPGFEADDLMATIVEKLRDEDVNVFLVSRDKDLDQLLSEKVSLFDPVKNAVVDPLTLMAEKGFTPRQAVEVQTLAGDNVDNVPGVQGVGVKTAAKLIAQYGSADAVLAHADELTPKMAERVKAFAAQLPITRQLVTLRRDVPMEFDLDRCSLARLNPAAARPMFLELGFNRLTDTLDSLGGGASPTTPAPTVTTIPKPPTSNYALVDTPEKFDDFVARLSRQTEFAFDTETTALNPVAAELVGMSFSWQSGEAFYLPVRGTGGPLLPVDLVVAKLKPILENPAVAKVGQNLKYDIVVMRQAGVQVRGLRFDTLLASFLLDPLGRSHSLDALAKSLLDHDMIPITDLIGKGRDEISMDQVDTHRACEYAAEDADYTWRLKEVFAPQMAGNPVEPLFRDVEVPLVEVLAEMEHNGIALDTALLKKLGGSLEDRLIELTRDAHKAVGHTFNLDSPKQLGDVLFDELQLPVVRKTKTGRSTDAETLEALSEQTEHALPKLILEYRELSKLKNTYVDTLPTMVCRRTGRVHASFHQTGAATGRLSSSDPNMQNIPIRTEMGRRIREAVIAGKPGHVLLTADYSQIELRLLAHFCQDKALLEAFAAGLDIHRAVAAQVNGVSPEEVTSAQRSAAKAVNFGIIYGQTAFGLSRGLGISMGDAKSFIEMYFLRYPGIRLFIDRCVADARKTGYAETILGRRRPIAELQSRNPSQVNFGERIAVNTVVQGSAADLIKRAMIDIHRELQSPRHSAKMLIQVHDELVFEISEKDVQSESEMIRQKMEHAIPLQVPIIVDIAWGPNWAEGK